jgi:hypothetical protein
MLEVGGLVAILSICVCLIKLVWNVDPDVISWRFLGVHFYLKAKEKAPGHFPTRTIEGSLSSPSRSDVGSIQDNVPDALQLPKLRRRRSSRSSSNDQ